jgi:hypothetical protein
MRSADPKADMSLGRTDGMMRRGGGRHDGRRSQQRAPEQHQPRVVPQQPAPRPSVVSKVGRFVKSLLGRLGGKRR